MASKEDLSLGEIAVKTHLLTREQLEECLLEQKNRFQWKSLGEIFLEKRYLTSPQLEFVVNIQKRNLEIKANQVRQVRQDNLFGRLLMRMGFATEKQISESLESQLRIEDIASLRLGEIMVKNGYITEEQLKKILDFQSQRQVTCSGCGQKYNLVLFNDDVKVQCYNCNNEITVSSLAAITNSLPQ